MSQHWIFYDQAGSIPGIPDTFSNCTVMVHDDGSIEVLPLLTIAIEASAEVLPLIDAPVEAVAPVEEAQPVTIVPEPEAAPASPQFYS